MPNKSNVVAGSPRTGGAIFRAPLGTPAPTDAKTPLDAAFVEMGYASSDGWSRQINKAYQTITGWGGDELQKIRSEHSVAFSTTLVEALNPNTQKAKWGEAAVTQTAANSEHGNLITISYSGADTDAAMWVFDMADGGRLRRTVFFNAIDTTDSFEQTYSDQDVIQFPFNFSAYRDDVTGLFFIDYTDDGKVSA